MELKKVIESNEQAIRTIADELHVQPTQVRQLVSEVVPTLVSGIRQTAKNDSQVDIFFSEFEKNHLDRLLSDPSHIVEKQYVTQGNEILQYIWKNKEINKLVSELVEKKLGIEAKIVNKVFPMLATILVGLLEKTKMETLRNGGTTKEFTKILDQNGNTDLWKQVLVKGGKYFK